MPAPASVISHGLTGERMRADLPRRRSQQIDELEQTWCMDSPDAFQLGQAPPDYPSMRIVEIEPLDTYTGLSHALRIRAEGLLDGSGYRILSHDEGMPSRGWDEVTRQIYTRLPNAPAFLKGGQLMGTALTGVTGEADDEIFTKEAHGLISGQLADFTFSSGFGGCTSGTRYLVQRVSANTLRLADPAQTLIITGAHSTDLFTCRPSTDLATTQAHGLANDTAVMLPILNGGTGLSTFTTYYVRDATSTTFKLAATAGGTAINFTSDVSGYSTLVPLITLSSDGTDGTLTPVLPGYERLWVTDRRKSKALGCEEAEALGLEGYYHLNLQLMGLNQVSGEIKHPVRAISATAQAVSIEDFTTTEFNGHPVYTGETDDTLAQSGTQDYALTGKVDFDLPQVSLSITYISPSAPPTWMLGSGYRWVPTDAPAVTVLGLYGSTDTIHFPNGWKLGGLQSEQLPGQQLYLTNVNLVYQRGTTPAG